MIHVYYASRQTRSGESMFWLWTQRPRSKVEILARYSFYAWAISLLLFFLPINMKEAAVANGLFLILHLVILPFRQVSR